LAVWPYLGRDGDAGRCAGMEQLYGGMGWGGELARCRLLLAELCRRQADLAAARQHLDTASGWVLHAGSAEHLGLLHLVRARLALDSGDGKQAQRAVGEGLHLARRCGLGLCHVELLCAHAEVILARGDAPAAERMAGEALWRAAAGDRRLARGEAPAPPPPGPAPAPPRRAGRAPRGAGPAPGPPPPPRAPRAGGARRPRGP